MLKFVLVFFFSLNLFAALPEECKSIPDFINKFAENRGISYTDAAREVVRKNSKHAEQLDYGDHLTRLKSVCINSGRSMTKLKALTMSKMLCGHVSEVLQDILDTAGYHARTVYLYSNWNKESPQLLGHVFLEVSKRGEQKWEIQDPDYNLTYSDTENKRIGIKEIIGGDLTKIVPFNDEFSGWSNTTGDNLKNGSFYSVAFIPEAGLVYYNESARESGLIYQVVKYINENHPKLPYQLINLTKENKF